MTQMIPSKHIEELILLIRGQKVLLDENLARLYGVTTARLNQQVKRNSERFPEDFMLQLTEEEFKSLMLQNATSKKGRGGRRKRPYAFTEHGAIMLASVLNSPTAIRASIQVVRAFVQLREILATHKDLGRKLEELESKLGGHDAAIRNIFQTIRQLLAPKKTEQQKIGF
ncbi:MAG: ORF6N domain-containing protein [Deltaproteobacteria bacterium]|nr:ORF6N domain-containing protein [Deltaproteobacteria bacterium]